MRTESFTNRLLRRVPLLAILFISPAAQAGAEFVNLELRPAAQAVPVGAAVNVGLYAVANGTTAVPVSVMDVILAWNPAALGMIGVVNNGPYAWLSSGFPPIGDSDLNSTFMDGNAFYTARSQLGNPASATPEGLLVTTITFVAVSETNAAMLSIPETLGGADTVIIDGIPGLDVHGTLGSASVRVFVPVPFDFDVDGDVDLGDFSTFSLCFAGANSPPAGACQPGIDADFDGDGDVDLSDFSMFSLCFGGANSPYPPTCP